MMHIWIWCTFPFIYIASTRKKPFMGRKFLAAVHGQAFSERKIPCAKSAKMLANSIFSCKINMIQKKGDGESPFFQDRNSFCIQAGISGMENSAGYRKPTYRKTIPFMAGKQRNSSQNQKFQKRKVLEDDKCKWCNSSSWKEGIV